MTTKNDHKPTDEASTEKLGLSSAIHDLQSLKDSYRTVVKDDRELPPMYFGDIQTGPGITLIPKTSTKPESSADKWRGISLMLLMLLGLSTSAAAYMWHDAETRLPAVQGMDTSMRPTLPLSYLGPDKESPRPVIAPATLQVAPQAQPYQTSESAPAIVAPTHKTSVPDAPKRLRAKITRSAPPKAAKSSNRCDELDCLIDSSAQSAYEEQLSDEFAREEELSRRPDSISRKQAKQAFDGIQRSVNRCFENSNERGIAILTLRITMEGAVASSELSTGNTELRSCIQQVASGISFPKLKQPFTLRYPLKRL